MDLRALYDEQLRPAYNGMTPAEVAAALNTANVTVTQDVPTIDVRRYLVYTSQEWGMIQHYTKPLPTGTKFSTGPGGTFSALDSRVAAIMGFVASLSLDDMLPTSDPAVAVSIGGILDNLVTYGFISAGTRSALVAMGTRQTTRAAQLGLGVVSPGDVITARATFGG